MEPNNLPPAGDTVTNESGVLPANPTGAHEINANQPAQGDGNGSNPSDSASEAERLLEEARAQAGQEALARKKAEDKIVQMKREGKSVEEIAQAFAEFTTQTNEAIADMQRRHEEEREADREAMKLVLTNFIEKSKSEQEARAALASAKGAIPNISSQTPPAPPVSGPQPTPGEQRMLQHFGVKLPEQK